MGKDLCEADAEVRALYEEANEVLGYDLQRLCFEGPEDELRLTQNTQPAILVHSVATWTQLAKRGLEPALLAGHSLGEYSALVAAGVLTFADAVRTVHKRGLFMQEAVPPGAGSMAALLGVARAGRGRAVRRVRRRRRSAGGELQRPGSDRHCRRDGVASKRPRPPSSRGVWAARSL